MSSVTLITGTFGLNQRTLSGKALKAINLLFQNNRGYDFSPRTLLCQLFDAFVASILNHCSEVWVIRNLSIPCATATNNVGVYGQLARYNYHKRLSDTWWLLLMRLRTRLGHGQ